MATEGSVYRRKDRRWVAQYRDAKGKTRYLYRKTKVEVRKALREALRDRDEGFVPADKLTVGTYLVLGVQVIGRVVKGFCELPDRLQREVAPPVGLAVEDLEGGPRAAG